MTVFVVREPYDACGFSSPGDIVGVHASRVAAQDKVDEPAGFVNGDATRPVPSRLWIDEQEVQE